MVLYDVIVILTAMGVYKLDHSFLSFIMFDASDLLFNVYLATWCLKLGIN